MITKAVQIISAQLLLFSIYIDKQRSVWTLFPQILLLGLAYGIISRKMLSNALKLHKKYKFAFESKLIFP